MDNRRPAESFEDRIGWQKSHQLTLHVYKTTASFPREEMYGLVSQMRRAAVSVGGNIAEAFSDLGYMRQGSEREQAAEVGRLLSA